MVIKGGILMGAILGSIVSNTIEVIIYAVIAWAGIMLGKSIKAKKTSK